MWIFSWYSFNLFQMFENFNNCMDFSRNDPYLFSADLQLQKKCYQHFETAVKIKWLRNLRLIFGQSFWKLSSKFHSPSFKIQDILCLTLSCHLEMKVFAFPQILKSYPVAISEKPTFQQKIITPFLCNFSLQIFKKTLYTVVALCGDIWYRLPNSIHWHYSEKHFIDVGKRGPEKLFA